MLRLVTPSCTRRVVEKSNNGPLTHGYVRRRLATARLSAAACPNGAYAPLQCNSLLDGPNSPASSSVLIISHRCYSRTALVGEEDGGGGGEAAAAVNKKKLTKKQQRRAAKKNLTDAQKALVAASRDFNSRRAAYRRQVSQIRKAYAQEIEDQREKEQAARKQTEIDEFRAKLERQRLKNIRSANNARMQEERRLQRAKEFDEHLAEQQRKRDLRNQRLTAARQLVVDMLEEEAPLWLTTPEEVEAAFTEEAQQLLWAFPGGVLGAPNPSLDSHMWQHETHTWTMERVYKNKRQHLYEQLQEAAYHDANFDTAFWTPERLAEREEKQRRARLRADVQRAGRQELIQRQSQMMEERYKRKSVVDVPQPLPPPSMKMHANEKALEREGMHVLMEQPKRFFVFDKEQEEDSSSSSSKPPLGGGGGMEAVLDDDSSSSLLGTPVALRSEGASMYPAIVGKEHKGDERTAKEKKQAERQKRMLAAAKAEAKKEKAEAGDDEFEDDGTQQYTQSDLESDDEDDGEPPLDYDNWRDPDDDEWEKGLDPVHDKELLATPSARRYKPEDVDWAYEQLQKEAKFFENKFRQEIEDLQSRTRSEIEVDLGLPPGAPLDGDGEAGIESILLNMPHTELMELSNLDDVYSADMSQEDFSKAVEKIPSLTEEQVRSLMDRDRTA